MAEAPLLRVVDLNVHLGTRRPTHVLQDVSLTVAAGEVVGVIGETGSGKTTIARAVLQLAPVRSGQILLDGEDITTLRRDALAAFRRSGVVQYVFQDPLRSLDPDFTVERSIGEPLSVLTDLSRSDRTERVAHAAGSVGLGPELLQRRPAELSGGQRQRVAIARALVTRPKLIICDEPASALDASSRVQVLELLRRLADETGVGVLLITHDLGSLAGIGDSVVVLLHGQVVDSGTADDLLLAAHHPYTRLLMDSAPTIEGPAPDRLVRARLRAEVDGLSAPATPARAHRRSRQNNAEERRR